MEHLSHPELEALLEVAKAHSRRNWLMFAVGYNHGLRASELVGHRLRDKKGKCFGPYVGGLRPRDIADGAITVARLKGSEKTVHKLVVHADPLFNEAEALIQLAHGLLANQRLFPISRERLWQLFQRYGEIAGIARRVCHPHILKHSIASHSIQRAGIENVRVFLGHKSIASTGAYLKVDDATACRAVYEALGVGKPVQAAFGFNVTEIRKPVGNVAEFRRESESALAR